MVLLRIFKYSKVYISFYYCQIIVGGFLKSLKSHNSRENPPGLKPVKKSATADLLLEWKKIKIRTYNEFVVNRLPQSGIKQLFTKQSKLVELKIF